MSNSITGRVEVLTQNSADFWSIKVDGAWYGLGTKDKPTNFDKGSTISFQWETRKGFKNVVKGSISVVSAPAPESASSGSGNSSSGVDWDLKDRKIQWQSARNAAIEFLDLLVRADAISVKKTATPEERREVLEAMLSGYSEDFYNETVNLGAAADPANPEPTMSGEE